MIYEEAIRKIKKTKYFPNHEDHTGFIYTAINFSICYGDVI